MFLPWGQTTPDHSDLRIDSCNLGFTVVSLLTPLLTTRYEYKELTEHIVMDGKTWNINIGQVDGTSKNQGAVDIFEEVPNIIGATYEPVTHTDSTRREELEELLKGIYDAVQIQDGRVLSTCSPDAQESLERHFTHYNDDTSKPQTKTMTRVQEKLFLKTKGGARVMLTDVAKEHAKRLIGATFQYLMGVENLPEDQHIKSLMRTMVGLFGSPHPLHQTKEKLPQIPDKLLDMHYMYQGEWDDASQMSFKPRTEEEFLDTAEPMQVQRLRQKIDQLPTEPENSLGITILDADQKLGEVTGKKEFHVGITGKDIDIKFVQGLDKRIRVVEVGTEAFRQGMREDDIIVKIAGEKVQQHWTTKIAKNFIKGKTHRPLYMDVVREDKKHDGKFLVLFDTGDGYNIGIKTIEYGDSLVVDSVEPGTFAFGQVHEGDIILSVQNKYKEKLGTLKEAAFDKFIEEQIKNNNRPVRIEFQRERLEKKATTLFQEPGKTTLGLGVEMKCQMPSGSYDPEKVKKELASIINASTSEDSARVYALLENESLLRELGATKSISMKGITEAALKRRFKQEKPEYARLMVLRDRNRIVDEAREKAEQEALEEERKEKETFIEHVEGKRGEPEEQKHRKKIMKAKVNKWINIIRNRFTGGESFHTGQYDEKVKEFWKNYNDAKEKFQESAESSSDHVKADHIKIVLFDDTTTAGSIQFVAQITVNTPTPDEDQTSPDEDQTQWTKAPHGFYFRYKWPKVLPPNAKVLTQGKTQYSLDPENGKHVMPDVYFEKKNGRWVLWRKGSDGIPRMEGEVKENKEYGLYRERKMWDKNRYIRGPDRYYGVTLRHCAYTPFAIGDPAFTTIVNEHNDWLKDNVTGFTTLEDECLEDLKRTFDTKRFMYSKLISVAGALRGQSTTAPASPAGRYFPGMLLSRETRLSHPTHHFDWRDLFRC